MRSSGGVQDRYWQKTVLLRHIAEALAVDACVVRVMHEGKAWSCRDACSSMGAAGGLRG